VGSNPTTPTKGKEQVNLQKIIESDVFAWNYDRENNSTFIYCPLINAQNEDDDGMFYSNGYTNMAAAEAVLGCHNCKYCDKDKRIN
jgi:hypothetical protein